MAVWLPAILVAVAAALPLIYLVLRASQAGWDRALDIMLRERTLKVLARSIALAASVTIASTIIAVPLAWLTVRTDLPGRKVWAVAAALPLVIPSYVGGLVLVSAFGPRGLLQDVLAPLGVRQLPSIYGFPGALMALTLFSYPYLFLTVRAALRGMDPALEEAARSLGSGQRGTFFRVTLPQLGPAVATGSILVALYSLSDFGAVSLLQFDSFTRAIYVQYRAAFDRTPAAILALMLVALTALILLVESRMRGKGSYHRSTVGSVRPAQPIPLGRWRWPAIAYCSLVVLLALVVPVLVLSWWLARGLAAGEPLRLVWSAALNSIYASGLTAGIAVLASLPVAICSVRFPGRITALIERLAYIGYGLPGIVLALALVFFGANYAPALYQGMALLIFAYATHFLPQALGPIRAALLQSRPSFEEAARGLGRNPLQVVTSVTAPLARSGMLAGGALVFLTTMKELPATLLLGPTGFDTLATRIWSATSEAFFARAAAPALLLITISALPMYLLTIRERAV